MTKNKNKSRKFVDNNMNSNPEYKNNGEDPSKTSSFNSNYGNTTSWKKNNSWEDGQQKRPPGNFKNNDAGSKYGDIHPNKGRGQNNNSYYNKSRGQNSDNSKGSKDNNHHFNKGEGQNSDSLKRPNSMSATMHDINYYENSKQINSTNFQKGTNSKKPTKDYRDRDDCAKNYENKGNGKIEHVGYMSQELFLKNFNSAENSSESLGSEINNRGNLLEPKIPVPFPRTSVSKFEDNDGKGARKKQKGNNDKNQLDYGLCMTCEKVVAKKEFHKEDHRVLPVDKAIAELKEQDQNKIVNAIEALTSQLNEEIQTKGIINLYEGSINPCLSDVFKKLKTSTDHNLDQLNQIRDSGMGIMNSSSIDNITDMIKLMDFRNKSQNIITKNQKLLSDLKLNPCWLIFSWFKISIGLIMQSGVKIFTKMESKTSASSSYANFDLYGDRLRLFSFRRNITLGRDAIILPFESIRALFKNEDSKCFMIVGNKNQEGQVVIRINKEVFWGRQFISLCLGDSGPSLRNTRFFRSCGRGKPYHHIWGGDYSQNDGSGGEAFLPWDEPLKQSSEEIVKGLLAARYGYNDRSSIFRIYIKGSEQIPPMKDNFCFGYVEEGMETLEFFASQSDVTKATILDAGCFLVLK